MRPHFLAIALVVSVGMAVSDRMTCQAQVAPARVLAIVPSPKGGPPITAKNLPPALALAMKAQVDAFQLFNTWAELEPGVGSYQLQALKSPLDYLGGQLGWHLMLTIGLINTLIRQVPPDLATTAWDDPTLIQRFHRLLDAIIPLFNSHLEYLAVGNEVDIYFQRHPDELGAYQTFYNDAVAYLHSNAPGVRIGVTTTFEGASGTSMSAVQALNLMSDVFILTYYPLGTDFIVSRPQAPLTDFPRMIQLFGGRPVILQEVGYPSSTLLKSSAKTQAQFVDSVFTAWTQAGASIPFLSYDTMHDFGDKFCDELKAGIYSGVPDPDGHFEAYLCSLGLRYVGGSPKAGWSQFVKGANALRASEEGSATPGAD